MSSATQMELELLTSVIHAKTNEQIVFDIAISAIIIMKNPSPKQLKGRDKEVW